MGQPPEIVKVREPGVRLYDDRPASNLAPQQWEYAVMAVNSYRDHWHNAAMLSAASKLTAHPLAAIQLTQLPTDCLADEKSPLPLPGWYRWADFPEKDPALEKDANKQQLFFEVWQKSDPGEVVAIVFRGTVPSKWRSWVADFRWFIPFHDDQYTLAAGKLAGKFADELAVRAKAGLLAKDYQVVTVGHSLGGGLAQQLAYSLPKRDAIPRISSVYAFDPSPVTGYFSVDSEVRDANKQGSNIR